VDLGANTIEAHRALAPVALRLLTGAGLEAALRECPAPESCEIAQGGACKPYGRMNVRIGDEDELGSFVFRTTGFNSIRTLATRLQYFHAVSGGLLASLPMELRLRGKSTAMSHRSPIYYVDLVARGGMTVAQAVAEAKATSEERRIAGYDQAALDAAAKACLANGAFEESGEEGGAVVEEFVPDVESSASPDTVSASTLSDKLQRKAASLHASGPR
jgi:hypothetical protein